MSTECEMDESRVAMNPWRDGVRDLEWRKLQAEHVTCELPLTHGSEQADGVSGCGQSQDDQPGGGEWSGAGTGEATLFKNQTGGSPDVFTL